jgi:hypothetical protein
MFSIIQRNIDFHSEFYVHLLCEIFVVLDYDEMNCNIICGVFFTMSYEVQILLICNNHEYDERMNCIVKFAKT